MDHPLADRPAVRAVCVTGMHRSGTSFAARTLHLLGVSLGEADHLMAPGSDNPAGYWENRYIKELDDEVLAHLGGSWDQPPVLDPGWESGAGLDPWRARAATVLTEAFATVDVPEGWIGWKDPRLSLLLPFWRTVMPIETTIVVVRHPREVAASLARRNDMAPAQAALLWLRYLFAATSDDPHCLVVDNQAFFDDLPATLARLADHLRLARPTNEIEAAVRGHADPDLRHHVAGGEHQADDDNPIVEIADTVWNTGDLDLDALPDAVRHALRTGWFRPPSDGEELARARAQVVELTERLRRRKRERLAAQAAAQETQ